jgi:hypothetical protein
LPTASAPDGADPDVTGAAGGGGGVGAARAVEPPDNNKLIETARTAKKRLPTAVTPISCALIPRAA